MNTLSISTFNYLIKHGIVPKEGNYDITEDMLSAFISVYSKLGTKSSNHSKKFARKLAGLSCLKHKLALGYKFSEIKEGIVYFIENPAWPGLIKVGITVDLDKRLATYQTYSPYRDYRVMHYNFVLDRRSTEKRILSSSLIDPQEGEWVQVSEVSKLRELLI